MNSDSDSDDNGNDGKTRDVADDYKAPGDPTKHDMTVDRTNEHISKKVYLFPEAFNELRKELEGNFPTLWKYVGGDMANNAQRFIHKMDDALDLVTQFDSGNVDGICKRYLDKLRSLRGLKPLHNPSEYFHNQQMEDMVKAVRRSNEEAPWLKH
jgi:hypothetical protein